MESILHPLVISEVRQYMEKTSMVSKKLRMKNLRGAYWIGMAGWDRNNKKASWFLLFLPVFQLTIE